MMKFLKIKTSLVCGVMLFAFLLSALAYPSGSGFGLEGTEDQIKGAMMVNFIKFIHWPEQVINQTGGVITIGVFGHDRFENSLDPLEGRMVGGYRLSIRRIHQSSELVSCQVVFIGASEDRRSHSLLQEISGRPILTIGEDEAFLASGGIIRFYMEENHVRFEINNAAAQAADLKISAKLIEIAAAFK